MEKNIYVVHKKLIVHTIFYEKLQKLCGIVHLRRGS